MSNKSKGSGPKTDKGKAISSGNSITHGLTAKRWINDGEQELFDATLEALTNDFNPQSHIEEMLIAKLAECTVRLSRMQRVEDAMFDLASSEATHPKESIKSLNNNSDNLTQAVHDASSSNYQFDAKAFAKKINLLDEIDSQNLSDVSGWSYIENHMPFIADHIIQRCFDEQLTLDDFILREIGQSTGIRVTFAGDKPDSGLSNADIVENSRQVSSPSLQEYLSKFAHSLSKDLQVQLILKDLEKRIQQIKNSAMPDTQKLNSVQRYRTADERQFSKTLGELFEVRKRLNKA